LNLWKKNGLTQEEATKDEPMGELINNTTTHQCPCNYNCTTKLMEACGAVSMITMVYNAGKDVLLTLIGDDDSTMCSNSKHSIKATMAVNGWTNKAEHWPKTKGGNYVANNGKLPLHVRAIDSFLADPSHRGKSFGRALYKVEKKRGRELKFTAVDCERLKRNFNFWQRQNKGETFEVFQHRYRAVIDHHFGDHSCCQSKEEGGWCKFKNNDALIEAA